MMSAQDCEHEHIQLKYTEQQYDLSKLVRPPAYEC